MNRKLVAAFILIIALIFPYDAIGIIDNYESDKREREVGSINTEVVEASSVDKDTPYREKKKETINLDTAFKHPIILDSHNDTMMKVVDDKTWLPKVDLGKNTSFHIDIPKLRKGGLNIPFFAAYTEGYYGNTNRSISRTLALINGLYYTEKNNPDTFKISKDLNEIANAVNEKKIAAVPTIEGAYSLDDDHSLELLNQYNDLGIKAIGLTWNYSNKLGEGASRVYGDKKKTVSSGGLTEHGKKVILEMNRLGIVVDVSHMAESTFWDAVKTSKSPIIASHSGVNSIKKHNRNLDNKQLKALGKSGGVMNIVFYPGFLRNGNVYVSDVVDHIDYVVKLIGMNHVGIGSDFDGARMPKNLKDSSEMYKIRQELLKRKYSPEDIDKIFGKNMLRVLKRVEEDADHTQTSNSEIKIMPEYQMGQAIKTKTPNFKAKIESVNEIKSARLIVDGKSYKALIDKNNKSISFQLKTELKEKFHVFTFEVTDVKGNIQRETRIFYIDN